jgi:flagellar FliL protein
MADEEVKEETKKGGGNPLMIVLIVLIVLLLAGVGGLGYLMYSKGFFGDQPQEQQQKQAKEVKKADDEEEDAEHFESKIEGLVLNVIDAKGRTHLMKLSFSISSIEPTIEIIVEANKDKIIDSVIGLVSARSTEELLTVGGKAMLKDEMMEEINNILNDETNEEEVKRDSVKGIYFTSFVMK